MKIPLKSLQARVKKLLPPESGVSLWDVIGGAVPMPPLHLLDPRHRGEMVEALTAAANLPSPTPDRYELALWAALEVPYGLRELSPDITITESGDYR
jgi:hypothetical protein